MLLNIRKLLGSKENGSNSGFESRVILMLGFTALLLSGSIICLVVIHFQFGVDIWFLNIKNSGTAQYWGQIGDFVGGVLNPILSFFALMAVLFSLVLQREELLLAREDAKDAHSTQKRQSEIFEAQNFESVFFRLLDAHSKLAFSVRTVVGKESFIGMEGFDRAAAYYLPKIKYLKGGRASFIDLQARLYVEANVGSLGHYFRSLYQILKYIDRYGQGSSDLSEQSMTPAGIKYSVDNYAKQRTYSNILRAQLSNSEIACIFLNCLTPYGGGLKNYVEKYSFLKTLKLPSGYAVENVRGLYSAMAYSGLEEVSISDIEVISRRIYERRISKVRREGV